MRRADGAGDTFVFTQYLSFTTRWWEEKFYFGRSIAWPDVAGALSAAGNSGVLETLQRTPYSIGYIGVSFYNEIAKAQLGSALLKSYSGEFLLPRSLLGVERFMDKIWYYADGDKTVGPMSLTDIRAVLTRVSSAGRLLVWRNGFTTWVEAESVPELADAHPRIALTLSRFVGGAIVLITSFFAMADRAYP